EILKRLASSDEADHEVFDALEELAPVSIPVLCDVAKNENDSGIVALHVLAIIGTEAKEAVPTLVEILKQGRPPQNRETRFDAAVYALGRIGPAAKDAVPILKKYADDKLE